MTFHIGDEKLPGHWLVLCTRSPYFAVVQFFPPLVLKKTVVVADDAQQHIGRGADWSNPRAGLLRSSL